MYIERSFLCQNRTFHVENSVFITAFVLQRPVSNDNFGSGSGSCLSAYFGSESGSWKVKVSDPYGSGSATLGKIRIRDGETSGSGINIPDPQHW